MKDPHMIVRMLDKKTVQAMLKGLRSADNITVTGSAGQGYQAHNGDTLLFAAFPGTRDYLVRMAHNLFEGGDA